MNVRSKIVAICAALFALNALAQTTVTNSNNGTVGTVPIYSGGSTLNNSSINQSGGTVSITDPVSGTSAPFTGVVATPSVNSVVYADQFPGTDCGLKISNALTSSSGLNGNPGIVIVDTACAGGGTWTTAVSVGTRQALDIMPGSYTTSQPITLGSYSSLYCGVPSASPGSCTINAAPSAGLSALVTISGASAIIHDMNLNGYASAWGPGCTSGAGTSNTSSVLNVTSSGPRLQLERVEVECGGGVGISLQAENVDMSHMEVVNNTQQGLLCTNAADVWISGDSQFETNGYSGIELNGCSSVRMVQGDISTNGKSATAAAGTTGCGIYIHGTYSSHIANSNIFTEVQSGGNFYQDICDIGWDAVNGGRSSYSNSFIGFQSLGASAKSPGHHPTTPGTYPSIFVQDGYNDDFIGGSILPGTSGYGIQFTETATLRAAPSLVRATFAGPYNLSTAWSDTTAAGNDFTGSIVGSTEVYFLGPWISCLLVSANVGCTENLNGSYSNTSALNLIEPTMNSGGYQLGMQIGSASNSSYNSTEIGFTDQGGAGATSNSAFIGIYGGHPMTIDGNGNTVMPGNTSVKSGTNVVYRCTTAGTLPVGALTVSAGNCGASSDTGLRVN